jgi:hypothetical protein
MFSLEALMKANAPSVSPGPRRESDGEMSDQLWNMQAETPLFGTAHDQALLTTPLKMEPAPSMDSMTLPSHAPNGRRWLPIVIAACGGLALAGAGIWVFSSKTASPVNAATPAAAPAALEAPPPESAPADPAAAVTPPAAPSPPAAPVAEVPAEPTAAEPAAGEAVNPGETPEAAVKEPGGKEAPSKEKEKPSGKRPGARAAAPSSIKAAAVAFDKGAAKAALNAAAGAAGSCGQGGAPGKGKIQVTFAPSGKVSDAQLVEGPFGGTAAGKCALRHFKAAKVPAFSGAPVTVAKSFKVD